MSRRLLLLDIYTHWPVYSRSRLLSSTVCISLLLDRPEHLPGPMDAYPERWLVQTRVRVVCCEFPAVEALDHVVRSLDAFLGVSPRWTLARARDTGSLRLLLHLGSGDSDTASGDVHCDPFYRLTAFNEASALAAAAGDLDAIEWTMVNGVRRASEGETFATRVVDEAARAGRIEVLQLLHDRHRNAVFWSADAMALAVRNEHLAAVQWLHAHDIPVSSAQDVVNGAICTGNADMVSWMLDNMVQFRDEWAKCDVGAVAAKGDLEMVKWLCQHCVAEHRRIELKQAIAAGHVQVVEWLERAGRGIVGEVDIEEAAGNGHLEMVEWFQRRRSLNGPSAFPFRINLDAAAGKGHLHVLKALASLLGTKGIGFCSHRAMDSAASNGHLEIVQWLHTNRSEGCTAAAMDGAAKNGHFDVVKWLHAMRSEGCTVAAMNRAAANGHLQIVRWLHNNRREGCTTAAMDNAASNGHLQVIEWLDDHRSEGCTSVAIDSAAANGHLDVVQWLHERNKRCTHLAMDRAAGNGHLEMIQWLHANRSEGCTTQACDNAARHGRLSTLRWLCANRCEGFTSRAMDGAVYGGHFEVVLFLHVVASVSSKDSSQRQLGTTHSVINAIMGNHLEILQWLLHHYPDRIERWSAVAHGLDLHSSVLAWLRQADSSFHSVGGR